ncbi:MAG: hypothetical protein E8D42_02025 [Nitrospira sp.]|nr:MAG: hypothetical protein E8D42_02025 [Nitrospira sp.]
MDRRSEGPVCKEGRDAISTIYSNSTVGGEVFGYQSPSRGQQAPVSRPPNSPMALRRQMVVSNLVRHVKEIQKLNDGYALRFHRSDDSEDLIGIIADYIVFESLNSPQLTFAIVQGPRANAFWLQVRGLNPDHHDATSPSIPSDSIVSPLA